MEFLPIILSVVVSMIIGFVWYGPLFGNQWMKLVNLTKKDIEDSKDKMPLTYAGMAVISLIQAVVLYQFIISQNIIGVMGGVLIGFFVWFGFVATVNFSTVLFSKKPFELFAIESGYQLVYLLMAGALIGAWR
ncbi:MAG: hypothetical protein QG600_539 [Patescibacteria group bacterium]|nr:hypothetical protein [Patescibacteria group bacterium]